MKLYKVLLEPESNFATLLRGDTLFGQLCWATALLYGHERLSTLLGGYKDTPFLIVSDPFVPGYLPKPSLPGALLGESADEKKENRKRIWMKLEDLKNGAYERAKTDEEVQNSDTHSVQVHNSLNYLSFNTDGKQFAPYSATEYKIGEKELYCLLDETQFDKAELDEVLRFVGNYGYGKESSIGKGRFSVGLIEEVALPQEGTTFMTLGPAVLQGCKCIDIWYDTFTRFGKHGAHRAHTNAFKRPILMSERGAVVKFDSTEKKQFIGQAVHDVSPAYPDTVHQGYAIVVAVRETK
jgi:CRISPR-associated protein Csm4